MSLKFRDELVIGGSGEWDYKPFRFNVRKLTSVSLSQVGKMFY